MIKIVLIVVFVVACSAQDEIHTCMSEAPTDFVEQEMKQLSDTGLTEEKVADLLGMNVASTAENFADRRPARPKRAVAEDQDGYGAVEARHALVKASGNLILNFSGLFYLCPELLSTTKGGQELCPSYQQLLISFYSTNGNGFCFVLFPKWQRIYQTRCKCRECRNSCPWYLFPKPISVRYRNYCKPKYQRGRYVWSVCIGKTIRFVQEPITENYGGCECRAYRTCF